VGRDVFVTKRHIQVSIGRCQISERNKNEHFQKCNFSLELGTNVTILSHCHIIFQGSDYNKPGFENRARSWVPGAGFLDSV